MGIVMELELPNDNATVPLVRHLLRYTLTEIGTAEECIADVELALTEACANVIEHAEGEEVYQVTISVKRGECEIQVVDTGNGFDQLIADEYPASDVEHGRGLLIMKALMDHLEFESHPEQGTVVCLRKALAFGGEQAAS